MCSFDSAHTGASNSPFDRDRSHGCYSIRNAVILTLSCSSRSSSFAYQRTPQYHTLSSVALFVLVRSNMSEFIDLTGDDSSSDDGSSVDDHHERPRKNGIASSSFAAAAASRHSNDSGDESEDDDKGKIIPYVYAFIS